MQLFAARFLERSADVEGARKAFALVLGELSPGLLEVGGLCLVVSCVGMPARCSWLRAACLSAARVQPSLRTCMSCDAVVGARLLCMHACLPDAVG